jgi:hypothetical protein
MKSVAVQKAINVIKMKTWTNPVDFRYQDEPEQFLLVLHTIRVRGFGQHRLRRAKRSVGRAEEHSLIENLASGGSLLPEVLQASLGSVSGVAAQFRNGNGFMKLLFLGYPIKV